MNKFDENMTIQSFAQMFNVCIMKSDSSKMQVFNVKKDQEQAVRNYVVKHKPEIMSYLRAEAAERERAAAERKSKIDAIPGLKELEAAIRDEALWNMEMMKNIERGDSGVGLRPKPVADIAAIRSKYPRAHNYLCAQNMSFSHNSAKATAGQRALERIINGEDGTKALEDANAEWSAYCEEHIWD